MELRKSHRYESATTERQTHTFEHLAVKRTPSTVFALWDSRHQQGKRGFRASARLTRGDIRVARPHVEWPRACLRQDGAALANTNHTGCVNSSITALKLDDRHTKPNVAMCVPGQTHKRQLEHVPTLQPHADVRKEIIHSGATLEVTQVMWGGD
jgi:hypothetical protein